MLNYMYVCMYVVTLQEVIMYSTHMRTPWPCTGWRKCSTKRRQEKIHSQLLIINFTLQSTLLHEFITLCVHLVIILYYVVVTVEALETCFT